MLYSFITLLTTSEADPAASNASIAGVVTLEGMLAVFTALTVLWICIEVMHLRFHRNSKKVIEESCEQVPATPAAAPAAAPAPGDDAAVIAAITAAIAAMREEEGSTAGFRVVSFKRVSSRKNRF